jgi:hypothetical protein
LLDSLRFKHNNIINLLSTFKVSLTFLKFWSNIGRKKPLFCFWSRRERILGWVDS